MTTVLLQQKNTHRQQRNDRFLWMLLFMLVITYLFAASLFLYVSYQRLIQNSQQNLDSLSRIYDDNLSLQQSNLDSIIQSTQTKALILTPDELNAFVTSIASRLPQLRTIVITDAQGVIIADSREDRPAVGIDVSDRQYFIVHAQGNSDDLHFDQPILSRVDSQWSLPITRGIWDDDGEFLGIIVASIAPSYFSGILSNLMADDSTVGYILNDDNIILSTVPYNHDEVSKTLIVMQNQTSADTSAIYLDDTYFVSELSNAEHYFSVVFAQEKGTVLQSFGTEVMIVLTILVILISISTIIVFYQVRYIHRIEVESSLRQQKEREYRLLAENVEDFIVRFDKELRHIYVNPALLQFSGIELHDYIGKTNEELGQPDELVTFWNSEISKVFRTGVTNVVDFALSVSDETLFFQAKITPEFDKAENVESVLSVVRNITDSKHAEQLLLQERNLLRTVIDNIPDAILVKDKHGKLIVANQPYAAQLGMNTDDILGTSARDLYAAELAEIYIADDELVLNEGLSLVNLERSTTTSDGKQLTLLVTKLPLQDGQGNIIGMIAISRDVTDIRELEKHQQETEKLQFKIEQERRVVELKKRFISMASHDFKTPLAIIKSTTSLIQRYVELNKLEKVDAKIVGIYHQVDRMTDLLNDVLNIDKASDGKLPVHYRDIALKPFCQDIWDALVLVDNGQHQVTFKYDVAVERITADEKLLHQVLENVLSNAFKYTPSGGAIQFSAYQDDETLCFKVSDDGIGVPADDLEYLFDPFHRAKNVRHESGTGLGLAIVKEYIELHGGHIAVESEEKVGTTFTVHLPILHTSSLDETAPVEDSADDTASSTC